MAETKAEADTAFDYFAKAYGVKYDRAVKCLTKDRADLLAFHDFPAEHWKHIRTTNPIESTFATAWIQVSSATFDLKAASSSAMASSGVNGGVKSGHWAAQKSATLGLGVTCARRGRPSSSALHIAGG